MRIRLFCSCLFLFTTSVFAQKDSSYHKFSTGVNIISAAFKTIEINNEFMLNDRFGIIADLGYQFSSNAGKNLNLKQNKISGYYAHIGPRLYFSSHSHPATAYVSGGYVFSYFKQSATINESDFYEPYLKKLETKQKLDGTYLGLGSLIKLNGNFYIDFGSNFYFYSPKKIDFAQDYNNVTNAQPGFGNFIFKNQDNVGLGIGIYCSFKYSIGK